MIYDTVFTLRLKLCTVKRL